MKMCVSLTHSIIQSFQKCPKGVSNHKKVDPKIVLLLKKWLTLNPGYFILDPLIFASNRIALKLKIPFSDYTNLGDLDSDLSQVSKIIT